MRALVQLPILSQPPDGWQADRQGSQYKNLYHHLCVIVEPAEKFLLSVSNAFSIDFNTQRGILPSLLVCFDLFLGFYML